MATETKNFDLNFPNRFDHDPEELEFRTSGGSTTVLQFKTALGGNVVRSLQPDVNPNRGVFLTVPTNLLSRLTDGNPDLPFRYSDVKELRWELPPDTDVRRISVFHEPGTQPNDVVIATSEDGVTPVVHWSNDSDDSLNLGWSGTDPVFIADEEGLVVDLNCVRARYVHVFTSGFTSTGAGASSDETRISEVQVYECIYGDGRPTLRTKETARLTEFDSLTVTTAEYGTAFLLWNVIVNGNPFFYDGVAWVEAEGEHDRNTTAELEAHVDELFTLPTVYLVGFDAAFVSETGEQTAELSELSITFDNDAVNKTSTTRVFGQVHRTITGGPNTDVWVTAHLEANVDGPLVANAGSKSSIIFANQPPRRPDDEDRVDGQGVFFFDVVPNTNITKDNKAVKSRWVFTFWRRRENNVNEFVPTGTITEEIPQLTKYNLAAFYA